MAMWERQPRACRLLETKRHPSSTWMQQSQGRAEPKARVDHRGTVVLGLLGLTLLGCWKKSTSGRASQRLVQDQGSLGASAWRWCGRLRQERGGGAIGRRDAARTRSLFPGAGKGRHPRTATKTSTGSETEAALRPGVPQSPD